MYLDIFLQLILLYYLTRIVEVNSPNRKWIMGVCDLNYSLGCVDICYLPHLNKSVFVLTTA